MGVYWFGFLMGFGVALIVDGVVWAIKRLP